MKNVTTPTMANEPKPRLSNGQAGEKTE